MRITPPVAINLTASNVPDTPHAEWSSVTAYAADAYVKVAVQSDGATPRTPHEVYKALDATTGDYPPDNPTKWLRIGATPPWAMFDSLLSTQTRNPGSIAATVTVDTPVDRIYLFGLDGYEVRIHLKDPENGNATISDETLSLYIDDDTTWDEYLYTTPDLKTKLAYTVPGYYYSLEIEITITAAAGTDAACAYCVIGRSQFVGQTELGSTVGIQDYSIKSTDGFGETFILARDAADTLDVDLWLDASAIDRTHRRLKALRATAIVYDANNAPGDVAHGPGTNRESLIAFGYYADFRVTAKIQSHAICNLEVEALAG